MSDVFDTSQLRPYLIELDEEDLHLDEYNVFAARAGDRLVTRLTAPLRDAL
jgi:hypothetical protein